MKTNMQHTALFGYGITTKPLAQYFENVVFYDDAAQESYTDEHGFLIQPSSMFEPQHSTLQIPSPGIPPHHPLIQKASHLISEYDFFANTQPFKIWISGTNGKTTTTQMMHHLLKNKGAVAGGNIGTPLALLDTDAPIWILETSSFTLHYTNKAVPNIYVLLPLSPDHLSWHGSMQEYIDAKLKPLSMMRSNSVAIIPKAYENTQTDAQLITYDGVEDLAQYFEIDTQRVKFKGAFLLDALLALGVYDLLSGTIDYDAINSFTLDPHRQEELYDTQGRLWVNDTKATNLDATKAAVARYKDKFIHLILGGDDKGVDLSELFEFLQSKNLRIYAIGSNKNKLEKLSQKYNIACCVCTDLQDAIQQINTQHTQEDVALLSPAAASLDEFSSYAQRGELFKKGVEQL